ncbi:protein CutA homolog [Episyrphus balteatus]|uniref:protein CutA homolog n=1 Tax=Episyrphus balteatus TaxID=286459 RepID=UPI0024851239|nr:protein CutA homolog [Episyrphus balteatus]
MKIALRPLLGTSYICLLRLALGSVSSASSTCAVQKSNTMSTSTDQLEYIEGSSSVAYITTPDEVTAKKLARSVVEARLAACVNIIPKITSIYVWEDKVQEDNECLLMVKTRTSRVKELTKFVRENHPYSVAEVISLPIQDGNPPYMDWIKNTIKDA